MHSAIISSFSIVNVESFIIFRYLFNKLNIKLLNGNIIKIRGPFSSLFYFRIINFRFKLITLNIKKYSGANLYGPSIPSRNDMFAEKSNPPGYLM